MCSHEYGSQQVELEVSQDEEEPKKKTTGKDAVKSWMMWNMSLSFFFNREK